METTTAVRMEAKKRNYGMVYGLIAGLCMILFTFILYKGGVERYMSRIAYLGYIFSISLASAAALAQKKANGGWLEFSAALRTAFTVFVIALALQTLFSWLLVNVLDTNFKAVLTPAVIANDALAMRHFGMSDNDVNQMIAIERGKDLFSLSAMTLSLASVVVVHFVIALLIAAIVKKKKSE